MNLPTFTLLIVEDYPANRELYRHSLLKDLSCEYRLLEAESMAEGLKLCRTRCSNGEATPTIDAILLDYALPDGDGLEFLAALSAQTNGNSPPVVMMTGHGSESIAVQAMKLGVKDYLVKRDFTPELLQLTMRRAIENTRLRRQLRHSEDRFRASVENLPDCFGIYSAIRDPSGQISDFRFDYLNVAALASNRMTENDIGKHLCESFPSVRETGLFSAYCEVVETGTPLVKEDLSYSDLFGGRRLTRTYSIQIGKLDDGFVASWRDVTDRKQIELARFYAEQERDRFFNLSIDLMTVGNFDGYFVGLNPSWETVLGFTTTELMARPFLDFVHPDDLDATTASVRGLTAGKIAIDFENRYRCKDGSYRWLLWSAMPDVERKLWYAIGHDVTERIEIQAALKERSQELESFVHTVSHDLKAPLRAVANLSEWIEEDFQGTLSVHSQEQMTMLRGRVQSMNSTIDGLLSYALTGQTAAEIESVEVAQLLAEVIEEIVPPPTFTIDIQPNLPTLFTKRLLLSQVFANLIGNGIKHHHSTDGSIQISAQERGNFYEFAIADDGAGIAPEHHERVFRIFQAVNPQNRADSSGIGLAIVKKIVESQGGTIRLESQLGQGTTFYFTWLKRS
jgi:PAS domain S-box-containing protein